MISQVFRIAVAILCLAPYAPIQAAPICVGNCNLSGPLSVGSFNGGDGSLSILGGDTLVSTGGGFIGSFGSNQGTATVSGLGSRLDIGGVFDSQLFVGTDNGTGTLTITNNATVTANAFNNAPNFGDARTYIGRGGNGTVSVNSGGSLVVRDTGSFGNEDGILLGSSAVAGGAGTGTLNVVGPSSNVVARGNGAFITVGQANTTFSGSAPGTGQLNVANGANVLIDGTSSFGLLSIARGGSSSGAVQVSGTNSRIDITGATASITVADDLAGATGHSGAGLLHITQNATVGVQATAPGAGFVSIGFGLGRGTAIIDNGGMLNVDGTLRVSRNSASNNTQTGLLLVNDTGVVTATNAFIGNGTTPAINGILAGTGTLVSTVFVQTGGLVSPGFSPGTLTIDGSIFLAGGTLSIEVGGLNSGEYDTLNVLGTADFTNALIELVFINGFLPAAGDTVDFVSANSIVGLANASFAYFGLANGFMFDVSDTGSGLRFVALNDGAPVPEPGTFSLLLMASLLGAGLARVSAPGSGVRRIVGIGA